MAVSRLQLSYGEGGNLYFGMLERIRQCSGTLCGWVVAVGAHDVGASRESLQVKVHNSLQVSIRRGQKFVISVIYRLGDYSMPKVLGQALTLLSEGDPSLYVEHYPRKSWQPLSRYNVYNV